MSGSLKGEDWPLLPARRACKRYVTRWVPGGGGRGGRHRRDACATRWGRGPVAERRAAHAVDLGDVLQRPLLHRVGQVLDEPAAAEGVGDPGHAGFVGEDLLGAEGDCRRLLGGGR